MTDDLYADQNRRMAQKMLEQQAEINRLRRVHEEWGQVLGVLIEGLAERGVTITLGRTYTGAALAEIDRLRAELAQVSHHASRASQDLADEEQEHEALRIEVRCIANEIEVAPAVDDAQGWADRLRRAAAG